MKTIPLLLSFGALIVLLFVGIHQYGGSRPTEELVVTFDGFEGGYYFFSKEDHKAVQLTANDELPINGFDLANGDYVGKKFKIRIAKKMYTEATSEFTDKDIITIQIAKL